MAKLLSSFLYPNQQAGTQKTAAPDHIRKAHLSTYLQPIKEELVLSLLSRMVTEGGRYQRLPWRLPLSASQPSLQPPTTSLNIGMQQQWRVLFFFCWLNKHTLWNIRLSLGYCSQTHLHTTHVFYLYTYELSKEPTDTVTIVLNQQSLLLIINLLTSI